MVMKSSPPILRHFFRFAISSIVHQRLSSQSSSQSIQIPGQVHVQYCEEDSDENQEKVRKSPLASSPSISIDTGNDYSYDPPPAGFVLKDYCGLQGLKFMDAIGADGTIVNENVYQVSQWLEKGILPHLFYQHQEGNSNSNGDSLRCFQFVILHEPLQDRNRTPVLPRGCSHLDVQAEALLPLSRSSRSSSAVRRNKSYLESFRFHFRDLRKKNTRLGTALTSSSSSLSSSSSSSSRSSSPVQLDERGEGNHQPTSNSHSQLQSQSYSHRHGKKMMKDLRHALLSILHFEQNQDQDNDNDRGTTNSRGRSTYRRRNNNTRTSGSKKKEVSMNMVLEFGEDEDDEDADEKDYNKDKDYGSVSAIDSDKNANENDAKTSSQSHLPVDNNNHKMPCFVSDKHEMNPLMSLQERIQQTDEYIRHAIVELDDDDEEDDNEHEEYNDGGGGGYYEDDFFNANSRSGNTGKNTNTNLGQTFLTPPRGPSSSSQSDMNMLENNCNNTTNSSGRSDITSSTSTDSAHSDDYDDIKPRGRTGVLARVKIALPSLNPNKQSGTATSSDSSLDNHQEDFELIISRECIALDASHSHEMEQLFGRKIDDECGRKDSCIAVGKDSIDKDITSCDRKRGGRGDIGCGVLQDDEKDRHNETGGGLPSSINQGFSQSPLFGKFREAIRTDATDITNWDDHAGFAYERSDDSKVDSYSNDNDSPPGEIDSYSVRNGNEDPIYVNDVGGGRGQRRSESVSSQGNHYARPASELFAGSKKEISGKAPPLTPTRIRNSRRNSSSRETPFTSPLLLIPSTKELKYSRPTNNYAATNKQTGLLNIPSVSKFDDRRTLTSTTRAPVNDANPRLVKRKRTGTPKNMDYSSPSFVTPKPSYRANLRSGGQCTSTPRSGSTRKSEAVTLVVPFSSSSHSNSVATVREFKSSRLCDDTEIDSTLTWATTKDCTTGRFTPPKPNKFLF